MKLLRSIFLAAVACVTAASVHATTVVAPTFDELVERAQLIFEGTVTDVQSQWAGEGGQRHIVSYVTLQVTDGVKGDAGATYTLRMLGGTVGDDTMEISDSPKFKVGDRNILFVENNGTQFIPLVGIMYGRFNLRQDQQRGADVVLTHEGQPLADVESLGKDEHGHRHVTDHSVVTKAGNLPALSAADFKAAIRAKLSEQTR
jgi:hypothetical protein